MDNMAIWTLQADYAGREEATMQNIQPCHHTSCQFHAAPGEGRILLG